MSSAVKKVSRKGAVRKSAKNAQVLKSASLSKTKKTKAVRLPVKSVIPQFSLARKFASVFVSLTTVLATVVVPILPVAPAYAVVPTTIVGPYTFDAVVANIAGWQESDESSDNPFTPKGTVAIKGDVSVTSQDISIDGTQANNFVRIEWHGWICREVDTTGFENTQLKYFWNGDVDAEDAPPGGPDYGVVEYKVGGHCYDGQEDGSGWTELKKDLLPSVTSWSGEQTVDLPSDSVFLLRFRNATNATAAEHYRVDNVSISGTEIVTPPAPACSDESDNDEDGKTDYPEDPGCSSPEDDDETDPILPPPPPPVTDVCPNIEGTQETVPEGYHLEDGLCVEDETPPAPACSDGEDNDEDGETDYPADPGCESDEDDDETDPETPPAPACSDGSDNDEDGKTDYPEDPGCSSPEDDDETDPAPAACADGEDNDQDGLIDSSDPGCVNSEDDSEENDDGGGSGGSGGTYTSHAGGGPAGTPPGEVLGAEDEELACGDTLLKEFIKFGANNNPEEVKKLQTFLNEHEGESLPVTGFYGPLSYAAVKRFQQKYFDEIIKPWVALGWSSDPSGYVYKTTRRWINILHCENVDKTMPVLELPK